jgi:hypothetical protein
VSSKSGDRRRGGRGEGGETLRVGGEVEADYPRSQFVRPLAINVARFMNRAGTNELGGQARRGGEPVQAASEGPPSGHQAPAFRTGRPGLRPVRVAGYA